MRNRDLGVSPYHHPSIGLRFECRSTNDGMGELYSQQIMHRNKTDER